MGYTSIMSEPLATAPHWEHVFTTRGEADRSWTQLTPAMSLRLVTALDLSPGDPIVDVGGGASRLVDALLDAGYRDVTVLDVAACALQEAADRIGTATGARFVTTDVLAWRPELPVRLWHDRAVFHFLTDDDAQSRYVSLAAATVAPGGHLVLGTFAPDGPTMCSGLPVRRWSSAALADRFGQSFDLVDSTREVHRTPGGADQPFTWVTMRRSTERP